MEKIIEGEKVMFVSDGVSVAKRVNTYIGLMSDAKGDIKGSGVISSVEVFYDLLANLSSMEPDISYFIRDSYDELVSIFREWTVYLEMWEDGKVVSDRYLESLHGAFERMLDDIKENMDKYKILIKELTEASESCNDALYEYYGIVDNLKHNYEWFIDHVKVTKKAR